MREETQAISRILLLRISLAIKIAILHSLAENADKRDLCTNLENHKRYPTIWDKK